MKTAPTTEHTEKGPSNWKAGTPCSPTAFLSVYSVLSVVKYLKSISVEQ